MKPNKFLTAAIFFIIACSVCNAADDKRLLKLSLSEINLGVIDVSETRTAVVNIANVSDQAVTLHVRSGCACTETKLDKEILESKSATDMVIKIHAGKKGIGGIFDKIYINAEDQQGFINVYDIALKGEVAKLFDLRPSIVNFGAVRRGEI